MNTNYNFNHLKDSNDLLLGMLIDILNGTVTINGTLTNNDKVLAGAIISDLRSLGVNEAHEIPDLADLPQVTFAEFEKSIIANVMEKYGYRCVEGANTPLSAELQEQFIALNQQPAGQPAQTPTPQPTVLQVQPVVPGTPVQPTVPLVQPVVPGTPVQNPVVPPVQPQQSVNSQQVESEKKPFIPKPQPAVSYDPNKKLKLLETLPCTIITDGPLTGQIAEAQFDEQMASWFNLSNMVQNQDTGNLIRVLRSIIPELSKINSRRGIQELFQVVDYTSPIDFLLAGVNSGQQVLVHDGKVLKQN